jgi:hypothetical protein
LHVPPEHEFVPLHVLPGGQQGCVAPPHGRTPICAIAACTADVALPMTVNVGGGVPVSGAVADAVSVRVEVPPAATLVGLNPAVMPVGRSWMWKVTLSAVPAFSPVVTV